MQALAWLSRISFLASGLLCFVIPGAPVAAEIGIAWSGQSASILVWEKVFKDRLAEIAPQIKVESIKEIPTLDELGKVLTRYDTEKDAIVLFRSNSVEYVLKNPTTKPTFFGSVNNVAELGIIKNPPQPEANYTAASYFIAPEVQLQSFLALAPKVKRLAFV